MDILTGTTQEEKNKSLNKHTNSATHIQSVLTWREHQQHLSRATSIPFFLQNDQLSKIRCYINFFVDIVHFLCQKELPV